VHEYAFELTSTPKPELFCIFKRRKLASQKKSKFANYSQNFKFLGEKICCPIILVRTALLDSQPVTISVVMDSWCSEVLHRTMLVWLLFVTSPVRYVFYNLCYEPCGRKCIKRFGSKAVESASNALFPK